METLCRPHIHIGDEKDKRCQIECLAAFLRRHTFGDKLYFNGLNITPRITYYHIIY